MAVLSDNQVISAMLAAGFLTPYAVNGTFPDPDKNIGIGLAICKAESGKNPAALGHYNGVDYFGLWQISEIHKSAFPDLLTRWKDPQYNTDCAYKLFVAAGHQWTPWQTYTQGTYERYLSGSNAAAGKVTQGAGGKLASSIGNATGLSSIKSIGAWVSSPHNWERVAMVGGGILVAIMGLYLLAKDGSLGSAAQTAAGKATTLGKIAGTAALA